MHRAVRVIVAVEPRMHGEVTILDSPEALAGEIWRVGPDPMVANRVPPEARDAAFWAEVSEASRGGFGPRRLDARISADGYSRSVRDMRVEHALAAFDRAELVARSSAGERHGA